MILFDSSRKSILDRFLLLSLLKVDENWINKGPVVRRSSWKMAQHAFIMSARVFIVVNSFVFYFIFFTTHKDKSKIFDFSCFKYNI